VPREVLYDNMRTVVTDRDQYSPGLHRYNRTFLDFAHHYGFLPRLCRPYRAQTKGKVERFIGYLRGSFYIPLASQLRPEGLRVDRDTANARVGTWLRAIANELLVKLGLRVSPRTIRKYLPKFPIARAGNPRHDQRWFTFLKNHAAAIIACDFFVVASASLRIFYVLVIMEHASRRIIHLNVTAHPTAAWTLQQLREAILSDHTYRFILHDRDAIFSAGLDASSSAHGP